MSSNATNIYLNPTLTLDLDLSQHRSGCRQNFRRHSGLSTAAYQRQEITSNWRTIQNLLNGRLVYCHCFKSWCSDGRFE